jgi:hypothetical protein
MLMWPKRDSRRPIRNATHSLSEGGRIGYGRGTAQITVYSVHNHRSNREEKRNEHRRLVHPDGLCDGDEHNEKRDPDAG